MRSVYHTQCSASQELFVRFMAMGCRKGYNLENISKFLRRMKVNGGDFIMRWYSGGIFFQNTSPVEKNEDCFILTWNSGIMPGTHYHVESYHSNLDHDLSASSNRNQSGNGPLSVDVDQWCAVAQSGSHHPGLEIHRVERRGNPALLGCAWRGSC
jgi:hypothetical protein